MINQRKLSRHPRSTAGSSLIELLIVVAIISILASSSITTFASLKERAQRAKALAEMRSMARVIQAHRVSEEKNLLQLGWDQCNPSCDTSTSPGVDPAVLDDTVKTMKLLGMTGKLDPWGKPYLVDANESEFSPPDCRFDAIWSSGPDGVWEGAGDGDDCAGDDLIVRIPFYSPSSCKPFVESTCDSL